MSVRFEIVDCETGAILGSKSFNLAFNIGDKKDAGFRKVVEWSESCVRGIRCKGKDALELRIGFIKDKKPENLFEVDGVLAF